MSLSEKTIETKPLNTAEKLARLKAQLLSYPNLAVAVSGGVDSMFLLLFAKKVYENAAPDKQLVAISAEAPNFPQDELVKADHLCAKNHIRYHKVKLDTSDYLQILSQHGEQRCYYCKRYFFTMLIYELENIADKISEEISQDISNKLSNRFPKQISNKISQNNVSDSSLKKQNSVPGYNVKTADNTLAQNDTFSFVMEPDMGDGFSDTSSVPNGKKDLTFVLADGTNADDMKEDRPGLKALEELKIASPLRDCGITKEEIRKTLAMMNIDIWNKPSNSCLATRFQFGDKIDEDSLRSVYFAESLLKDLGFKDVRVRNHGTLARVEIPPEQRKDMFDEKLLDNIALAIRSCGFDYVTLDMEGYKRK